MFACICLVAGCVNDIMQKCASLTQVSQKAFDAREWCDDRKKNGWCWFFSNLHLFIINRPRWVSKNNRIVSLVSTGITVPVVLHDGCGSGGENIMMSFGSSKLIGFINGPMLAMP